jgi:hypothetical protein
LCAKNHRGGVAGQRGLDDLPGINAGLGQGALERLLELDHAVLRVEPDADEHLVRTRADGKP